MAVNGRVEAALREWRRYAHEREELKRLGYCRSCKDPQSEFAEWLVKELIEGALVPNRSHRGYDVVKDGRRVQVKKYGRDPDNHANLPPGRTSLPAPNDEGRPTEFAYVRYEDGIPVAVYVCSYEWLAHHYDQSNGLSREHLETGADVATYNLHKMFPADVSPNGASEGERVLTVKLPRDVADILQREAEAVHRSSEELGAEWLSAATRRVAQDPLLRLAGAFSSEVKDVSSRHDEYIGEALYQDLRGNSGG